MYNDTYLKFYIFYLKLTKICNFYPVLMNKSLFCYLEHYLQFRLLDFIKNNLLRIYIH